MLALAPGKCSSLPQVGGEGMNEKLHTHTHTHNSNTLIIIIIIIIINLAIQERIQLYKQTD